MESQSHFLELNSKSGEPYKIHIKVFLTNEKSSTSKRPLVFIHGAIEDGKMFYSDSGKGLAPFLCKKGHPCYVVDLRARGGSTPPLDKSEDFNQFDMLDIDFPAIINFALKHSNADSFSFITHSWGGVLVNSFLLKSPQWLSRCKANVHISTKRRVGVINPHRLFYIDLMWFFVGKIILLFKGHLPANYYGPGGESRGTLTDSQRWVYSKNWLDHENGLDYNFLARKHKLPPTLYLTGAADQCLGHIKDVKRFALESQHPLKEVILLSKRNGHLQDYDHINILTSPHAPQDHFPMIAKYLEKLSF